MKKEIVLSLFLAMAAFSLSAQTYSWNGIAVDGRNTACVSPTLDNLSGKIGRFENGKYIAPSGKVYSRRSSVYKTAKTVLEAQPSLAHVKKVIGYSKNGMVNAYPVSSLSNWFIDNIMEAVEARSGKKVHFGVGNFGGIRCDLPKGEIILDDMLSMFPFKNQIVYEELYGRDIRAVLSQMACNGFQVIGGVKVVARDGILESVIIDGAPLDDDKKYGVATISFLLYGGDDLFLANNAENLVKYDVDIIDIFLDVLKKASDAGQSVDYQSDDRVVIL